MKNEDDGKPIKTKCPVCHSLQINFLKRSKSYWCRICGVEWTDETYNVVRARAIKEKK